jgi:acetyl esterase/lipase
MALNYLHAKISLLPRLFQPTYDALFSKLPLWCRWRLLALQPLNIIVALISAPHWLFSNRYEVMYVPTRDGSARRCLVFRPPLTPKNPSSMSEDTQAASTAKGSLTGLDECSEGEGEGAKREDENNNQTSTANLRLPPLHIDIHGGSFIGGFPEQGSRFCSLLSSRTGAVVISCTYRVAPRYTYPAAHDDVDDILAWVVEHAEELGGDREVLTVGGSSAGGGLGLSAVVGWHARQALLNEQDEDRKGKGKAQRKVDADADADEDRCRKQNVDIKAYLAHYAALDLRTPPQAKPRPANFPAKDPLSFMLPLYDIYAGANRSENLSNARLHPILSEKKWLPRDMFFVVAGIDILVHEQLTFVERVKAEIERDGDSEEGEERSVEARVFERGFHGWLECELLFSFLSLITRTTTNRDPKTKLVLDGATENFANSNRSTENDPRGRTRCGFRRQCRFHQGCASEVWMVLSNLRVD